MNIMSNAEDGTPKPANGTPPRSFQQSSPRPVSQPPTPSPQNPPSSSRTPPAQAAQQGTSTGPESRRFYQQYEHALDGAVSRRTEKRGISGKTVALCAAAALVCSLAGGVMGGLVVRSASGGSNSQVGNGQMPGNGQMGNGIQGGNRLNDGQDDSSGNGQSDSSNSSDTSQGGTNI